MLKELVGAVIAPLLSVSRVIDSAAEGCETLSKSYDLEKKVECFSKIQATLPEKDRQESTVLNTRIEQLRSLW